MRNMTREEALECAALMKRALPDVWRASVAASRLCAAERQMRALVLGLEES